MLCVNIYYSTKQPRGINMIDVELQSQQLPEFLSAQRSINTLFFRAEPLGKVSPTSEQLGCQSENTVRNPVGCFYPQLGESCTNCAGGNYPAAHTLRLDSVRVLSILQTQI